MEGNCSQACLRRGDPLHRFIFRLAVFLICVAAGRAEAQFYTGPIASGAGGAGRAAADASESSYLNPASLSFIKDYNVSFAYASSDHPVDGARITYAGMLADGTAERLVPGSLSFVHRFTEYPDQSGAYTEQDYQASFSGMVARGLSLGASAHRQLYKPGRGSEATQDNATIGALWVPTTSLGLAAVGYDLIPSNVGAPALVRQSPTYAVGINYLFSDLFRVRADVVRPTEGPRNGRNNVMAGFESQFRPDFIFRAGMQWRETEDKTMWTVGVGFHGPRLSFDYAFEKDLRVDVGFRHVIDMWLPL